MAGTARRGRGATRGRGGSRGAKVTTPRKKSGKQVAFSSDEEEEWENEGVSEDETPSALLGRRPILEHQLGFRERPPWAVNQVPSSEWVPISMEAEDDNDGSDPGVEEEDDEEEDQLEDEGEPVESDIGKVDSSPDYVAFTRPSTSPVRGRRTGMTMTTPPTPSPKKNPRKRSATPFSPEADAAVTVKEEEDVDEDAFQAEPVTPVRRRKLKPKKVIKSEEFIEDSEIEEVSKTEHKRSVARKGKQTDDTLPTLKTPSRSKAPPVVVLDKKIKMPGSKFPSGPVVDPDSPFIVKDSPPPQSPRKKMKMARQPSIDKEEDEPEEEDDAKNPEAALFPQTPVSKLTKQLNKSVLQSASKTARSKSAQDKASNVMPSDSKAGESQNAMAADSPHSSPPPTPPPGLPVAGSAEYRRLLQSMVKALGITANSDYFCPLLKNTYAHVDVSSLKALPLCNTTADMQWFTLDNILLMAQIKEGSRQQKALVKLVTTSQFTSYLFNPARCNVKDFKWIQPPTPAGGSRPPRPYLGVAATREKALFLEFGIVDKSHLLELQLMGNGPWMNKNLQVCTIVTEYLLACSFYANYLPDKVERISNYGGYFNPSSFPTMPTLPVNGPAGTPGRPRSAPKPKLPGVPVVVVHDIGTSGKHALYKVLEKAIDAGGVDARANIPVFDLRSFYGSTASTDIPHSTETFLEMCGQAERYLKEIPLNSLIGLFCIPSAVRHTTGGQHFDLSRNIVGIALLATPFNQ
ncbi:hypothetical protein BC629DRAFT_1447309 [Irpex lacteus]|nr:hypothetical protein BC629DRAFT_1447309 [Irpex lacteus]